MPFWWSVHRTFFRYIVISSNSTLPIMKRAETEFHFFWNGKLLFLKRKITGPTKSSGVMGTSHVICACHITKLNIVNFSSNPTIFISEKINIEYALHQNWQKSRRFCIHASHIIPPLTSTHSATHVCCWTATWKLCFCTTSVLVSTNMSMTQFIKHFFLWIKGFNKITGILLYKLGYLSESWNLLEASFQKHHAPFFRPKKGAWCFWKLASSKFQDSER